MRQHPERTHEDKGIKRLTTQFVPRHPRRALQRLPGILGSHIAICCPSFQAPAPVVT
ncbi:hypothetical protein BO443_60040 [Burkholderia orbicola]